MSVLPIASTPPTSSTPLLLTREGLKPHSVWSFQLVISVVIVCLNSIQYGYHMSELNAPESIIKHALDLTTTQIGLITSIFSIGGLVSSTLAGSISLKYGLKFSFIITSCFYIIGSFVEFECNDFYGMLIGRFISGVGAGFALVFVPLYINQISPVELRGLLGSMNQVSVNFGILLAQLLATSWSNTDNWRLILGFGALIGTLGLLTSVFVLAESPKWLILTQGDEPNGYLILSKLRNYNEDLCSIEITNWKNEKNAHLLMVESNPSLANLNLISYLKNSSYYNSRIIATFSMVGQQFAGINSIIFYGVKILTGLFPTHAITINCLISLGNMVVTFIASLFLDNLGRKPMMLTSVGIMGFASVGLSIGILLNNSSLTILSIFSYVGSFAIGCGPIPFLLISEVSQLEVKDLAQSWATDCNLMSCFVVGFIFPLLNGLIGGYVYLIFAAVCLVFWVFIKQKVPETKGKFTYNEVWGNESHRFD